MFDGIPIIGQWPSGEWFILFEAMIPEPRGGSRTALTCWTPRNKREWATVRQVLSGLSELTWPG